jgi:hypothetical protein
MAFPAGGLILSGKLQVNKTVWLPGTMKTTGFPLEAHQVGIFLMSIPVMKYVSSKSI